MLYRCPYELLFETRDSECNILESSISCRISCISYMLISSEFHFFSGNMIHHTCNLKDELCMLSLWGVQQDLWAVKEINTVWAVITVSLDVAVKKSAHTRCGDEALANVRVRTFFFITLYNMLPALQESSFSQRKEINTVSLLPDRVIFIRLQLQYKSCNRLY